MSNLKKHSLLIIMAMLILFIVPMSFAADVDNNATADVVGIDDSSEELSAGEDVYIIVDESEISMEEGGDAQISGTIYNDYYGSDWTDEVEVTCAYTDYDGTSRSYTTTAYGDFSFDLSTFTGLKTRDTPYVLTITGEDVYGYLEWMDLTGIGSATVSVTVGGTSEETGPAMPEYEIFTPNGPLYVAEDGSDDNDGSESAPYATIEKALTQNKVLGGGYEVIISSGTYTEYNLSPGANVIITGRGKVIIDANKEDYHFSVSDAYIIEFNNLTLINGKGTTGSISGSTSTNGAGKLIINNCTFKDNSGSIGVLRTYAETYIIDSTFINNAATYAYSGGYGNIIYSAAQSLTVNFCNFINNTPKIGTSYSGYTIDSVNKANANYNFWGANDGPSSTDTGSKVTAKNWVVINPIVNDETITAGESYDVNINYQYTNGNGTYNDLEIAMPELDVAVAASNGGTLNPDNVTVSDKTVYTPENAGEETITVSLNGNTLSSLTLDVQEAPAPNYDYSTSVDPASVDYVIGTSSIVTVTVDTEYLSDIAYSSEMYAWINGESTNNRYLISGAKSSSSFTFDLSTISDKLNVGENNITFHHSTDSIQNAIYSTNYNFATLTVTAEEAPYYGVIYVDDALGNDENDGNENDPVKTMAKAIELATSDDNTEHKIIVNEGTYVFSNVQLSSDLTIEGNGTVVLAPEGNNYHMYLGGSGVEYVFTNLIFVNGSGSTYGSISMGTTNKKVTIENCTFMDNKAKYYGMIYGYGTVVITKTNFINNTVTSSNGLIYAYSGSLDVSYSNFINTQKTGSASYTEISGYLSGWDYSATITFNNNYWGSNSGPSSSQVDTYNLELTNYVQLVASLNDTTITQGETYDLTLEFKSNKGTLSDTMAELDVALTANGALNSDTVTISNNKATVNYTAPEANSDTINVNHGSIALTSLDVTVEAPVVPYYGVIYVDAASGSDENNGNESTPVATIAKAIELATSDDNTEHKIIISEGTYKEHDLNITSALDISANGEVIIDAEQLGRIFNINTTEDVTITGITFKNGKEENGGAISIKDSKVTIDDCEFIGNEASNAGSAIYWDADDGVLTNTKFSENTARNGVVTLGVFSWSTGASGSNALVENCTFDNNKNVEYGNCIGLDVTGDDVTIKNTNFTNNKGEYGSEHGALYIKGDDATVENCLFENNSMGMAAAMQLDGEGTTVTDSTFINNTVSGYPARSGAVEIQNAAEITGCVFINNGGDDCAEGGAISIVYAEYGGDIEISNNKFINNSAQKGGAIYVDGGSEDGCEFESVLIDENTFDGNKAEYGAGIYTTSSDVPVKITDNEFKNMEAESGACVYSYDVDLEVEDNLVINCTSADGNNFYSEYGDIDGSFPTDIAMELNVDNIYIGENATIVVNVPDDATSNFTITVDDNVVFDSQATDGIISVNVTDLAVGEHTVVVSYPADTDYLAGTNTTKFTVSKYDMVIEINVGNIQLGENATITVKVPAAAENNVVVKVDGNTIADAKAVDGVLSVNVTGLALGEHTVVVSCAEDDTYLTGENSTTFTVDKIDVPVDDVLNITVPEGSDSPTFTINLPNATGNLTVTVDGKNYTAPLVNGTASITVSGLSEGDHNVTVTYSGDDNFAGISKNTTVNVHIPVTKLSENKDVTMLYSAGTAYKVLVTVDGKAVSGVQVTFNFNGKNYYANTNSKGYATIKLPTVKPKKAKYTVTASYNGVKVTNKVKVNTIIKASNKKVKKSKKVNKIKVKTKKVNGKFLKGKKLTLKIKGKKVKAKINKKGVATFKVKKKVLKKLKVGKKYKYTVSYGKDVVTKKLTIKK